MRVLVIGAGCFGLSAALELRARGCDVTIADPGPVPHPLAESTDVSKVVRCDYGGDEDYTELGERSLEGWRRWNAAWPAPLFHETGVAFLAREPMAPGGFEHDSFALLGRRGHTIERLDAAAIAARFPAYRPGAFVDGYLHREGGWAESGKVIAQLVALARAAGVDVRDHVAIERIDERTAIAGLDRLHADAICVCAGAWTQRLVPALAGSLRAVGQPVFHLRPEQPALFAAERFPVFGADISRTGYYGFPLHPTAGVVKIANHGTGIEIAHDNERVVTAEQEAALRDMVRDVFPALADAPVVYRRLCVYCDTRDEHFWIARDPERAWLTVATGGSGHAFKFTPALGALIADTVLGVDHRLAAKFRWRPEVGSRGRGDAARATELSSPR